MRSEPAVWSTFKKQYPEATPASVQTDSQLQLAWTIWQEAWKACDADAANGAKPFGYFWTDYDSVEGHSSGVYFGDLADVLDGDTMLPLYTRPGN